MTATRHKEDGDKYYRDGLFNQSIECYKKALSSGVPETHKIYSNRCACYLQLGHLNLALDDANICVRIRPDWPRGYLRQGSCLSRLGRLQEAITAYRKVLQLEAGNTEASEAIQRLSRSSSGASQQTQPESASATAGGWDLNGALLKAKAYAIEASIRALQWWSSLDNNTKTYMMLGGVALLVYYFFFSSSSTSYYDLYSDGYASSHYGLSWTTWGAIMLAAYKIPPMFPQVFGQYALPFFGMNMGTFMWLVNMLSNQGRGRGGGFSSFSPFGNRFGGRRRF